MYVVVDQGIDVFAIFDDILKRPFITVGFLAFVLLLPLALTSTPESIRKLGFKRWQRLHMLVYIAGVLADNPLLLARQDRHRPAADLRLDRGGAAHGAGGVLAARSAAYRSIKRRVASIAVFAHSAAVMSESRGRPHSMLSGRPGGSASRISASGTLPRPGSRRPRGGGPSESTPSSNWVYGKSLLSY